MKFLKRFFTQKKFEPFHFFLFRVCIPLNVIYAIAMFIYIICFITIKQENIADSFMILCFVVCIAQFVFAPLTNYLCTKSISTEIIKWRTGQYDNSERTALLKRIVRFPMIKAAETYSHFILCIIVLTILYYVMLPLPAPEAFLFFIVTFLSSYFSGTITFCVAEIYCSNIATELVAEGINEEEIKQKHYFGLSLTRLFIFLVCYPIAICSLLTTLMLLMKENQDFYIIKTFVISLVNILNIICHSLLYFKRIKKYNLITQDALVSINKEALSSNILIPVDFSTEMSYTTYLVNKTINLFSSIMKRTDSINTTILSATEDLSKIAQSTVSTALTQSSFVKDIVTTMESIDSMALSIKSKIEEVNVVAQKTASDVENGSDAAKQNLYKMNEIDKSNKTSIEGMQSLSNKIGSIWDIVNLIDSVADQTKIIAFNAELEAQNVSESQEKFKHVAYEIRLLADSVMSLTKEIRNHIQDIQNSSNTLIEKSQDCTRKISEGYNLTKDLEAKFSNIKVSSHNASTYSMHINLLVQDQIESFKNIASKLHQISIGMDQFSMSTQTISQTVQDLKQDSEHLGSLRLKGSYKH